MNGINATLSGMLPELYMVVSVCVLLMYGQIVGSMKNRVIPQEQVKEEKKQKEYSRKESERLGEMMEKNQSPVLRKPMTWLTIQTVLLAGVLQGNIPLEGEVMMNGSIVHDTLTGVSTVLVLTFTGLVLMSQVKYLRVQGIHAFEYPLLILLSVFAMVLLIKCNDLITLYLSVELQQLALYVLATFKRGQAYQTEAGLKYFIVGAFSQGLLLFGSQVVYGFTGTTNYESLSRLMMYSGEMGTENTAMIAGMYFITVALLFKMTAAPWHMWAPDVYEGSPTSSTLFFATVPKIALMAATLRLMFNCFQGFSPYWEGLFIISQMASLAVGAFGALYQRRIKRFLAYSSIGHIGYVLIGLACGTIQGIQGIFIYLIIYMVMSLAMWTSVLCLHRSDFSSSPTYLSFFPFNRQHDRNDLQYMDQLRLLYYENPFLAFTIAAILFSMAGIPPLAGFCGKLFVFFSAMEQGLYALALFAVLASVIGAFYYLRWVKIMFFEGPSIKISSDTISPSSRSLALVSVDREKSLILSAASFFIIFFFAHPAPLLILTHRMALVFALFFKLWRS